jgi:hypothetical protein
MLLSYTYGAWLIDTVAVERHIVFSLPKRENVKNA